MVCVYGVCVCVGGGAGGVGWGSEEKKQELMKRQDQGQSLGAAE